jgi:hypothetical protein
MIDPLDIRRLAVRIETLMHTSTRGWDGGDELEFRRLLPSDRDPSRHRLPNPSKLREQGLSVSHQDFTLWNSLIRKLEDLVRDNDPRNPRRLMRDLARGRYPFGR